MAQQFASDDEFLAAQTTDRRADVESLRALVREADPGLTEVVKWNSPNYVLDDLDRLTVNAAGNGPTRLILHFGTGREEHRDIPPRFSGDPERLLTWHSDIRASLPLPPAADLDRKRDAVIAVIRAWLAQS